VCGRKAIKEKETQYRDNGQNMRVGIAGVGIAGHCLPVSSHVGRMLFFCIRYFSWKDDQTWAV